ncbi:MAG: DUF3078 domain-containing protein [FCB group bacterium]|jgi:hypothetical protein
MKKVIVLLLLLSAIVANAQNDNAKVQADTIRPHWRPKGVASFNFSQLALSNWSQGGETNITWNIFGDFGVMYVDSNWKFVNNLNAVFGMSKTGDRGFRNNDNDLYFETVLSYKFGWVVDPFFSNTVRTVIANGYSYSDTSAIQKSAFWDPGYITQSLGFIYGKKDVFTTRLGFACQETFTKRFTSYTDDPNTPQIEKFRFDTGIECVTEAKYKLDDNLLHSTALRLFSRFNSLDVWDVRWDNTITAKITKLLNVNFNLLVIYEKQQSLRTQVKEALQVGIAYNLF